MGRDNYMQDVFQLVKSDDVNELLFYLDYIDQIIEMYVKRNMDPAKLKIEYEMVLKRIQELQ